MINDILNERATKDPDKIFITYKKQKFHMLGLIIWLITFIGL